MSAHKMHHSPELIEAMKNRGLVIETPSQLSDCFRFGWTAATNLAQASVAAALEAAARVAEYLRDVSGRNQDGDVYVGEEAACFAGSVANEIASEIRAMIARPQHDALAAHVAAEVAESRAYALALEEELRARTAKLERECKLTQAQVDRILGNSTQMYAKFDTLSDAAKALGAMPEGYCFCSKDRIGDDSKIHEPECRDLRAVLGEK